MAGNRHEVMGRKTLGRNSTSVQRRVSFALRPRRRFGPPRPALPAAAHPCWPGPAMPHRSAAHARAAPRSPLAIANRHHPAVRAGAREFLRSLQAVHPADTVLGISQTEVGIYCVHPERPAYHVHRHAEMGQDARAALAAPAKLVEARCLRQILLIQRRRVLNSQHKPLSIATFYRLLEM